MLGLYDQFLRTPGGHSSKRRVDVEKEFHSHRAPEKNRIAAFISLSLNIPATATCRSVGHNASLRGRNDDARILFSTTSRATSAAIVGSGVVARWPGHEVTARAAQAKNVAPERAGAPDVRAPYRDARVPLYDVLPRSTMVNGDGDTAFSPGIDFVRRLALIWEAELDARFIASLIKIMNSYGFDGLDLDWEYPMAEDCSGRGEDFENFVTFIEQLRKKLNDKGINKKGISLTLPSSYWYLQHFDIFSLQRSVDWFNIMSYDIHGSRDIDNEHTGLWVNSHTNLTEIQMAINLLRRNKIGPDRVVMGMSFYNRSFALVLIRDAPNRVVSWCLEVMRVGARPRWACCSNPRSRISSVRTISHPSYIVMLLTRPYLGMISECRLTTWLHGG